MYRIDPLHDSRWTGLVDRHPGSSAFHTVQWLEALHRTYGYQPVVYTTSGPGAVLEDGLVFCLVSSWITGRRLVSLPFSDHCEPLLRCAGDEQPFLSAMEQVFRDEKLRYFEIRASREWIGTTSLARSTHTYYYHHLGLDADLATLFHNCQKSSTQRKILRAEREGLVCESGRSDVLLGTFLDLHGVTRRRHRLPPQPRSWFRNLVDCFGEKLQIRVAFKDKRPLAAILTLRHKDTLVYKYGCSDARFSNLGGTHFLLWTSIQEGKRDGLRIFDLGRSDCDNHGLVRFKDQWGTIRSMLRYSRFAVSPTTGTSRLAPAGSLARIAGRLIPCLPSCVVRAIGAAVYKHIA